jgi:hypothetical protein
MVNFRRNDKTKVKEIRAFREELARSKRKSNGRRFTDQEVMFAAVEKFDGTAREHADAAHPLHSEAELRLKLWNKDKRGYNVEGDPEELIIGVPHRTQTLDGRKGYIFIEELAYDKTSEDAKKHQDRLNEGGRKKSQKLDNITRKPKLKEQHRRKLRSILRDAGIQ